MEYTNSVRRISEINAPFVAGRILVEPEPEVLNYPQLPESTISLARRLLRLSYHKNNVVEITAMFPEIISALRYHGRDKQDVEKWVSQHPFMQYLTYLLQLRVLKIGEMSYPQMELVVEGMAHL